MDKQQIIFQTNSAIVNDVYENNTNYLIEYDNTIEGNDCIIYFSSNNIYYPNDESTFRNKIIDKNSFEWYSSRIPTGKKHLFVRDIKKQWYLTGINSIINNPQLLFDFLKKETEGYNVITIGSSAGGYAAILYGSQLNAKLMYSFNGQMELSSLLKTSRPTIDPIIFEYHTKEAYKKYYDLIKFIKKPNNIFYFYSNKSNWDLIQYQHIKETKINIISFNTAHHGIPFLKPNLITLLRFNTDKLVSLTGRKHSPLLFSIKLDGFLKTIGFLYTQFSKKYLK